ncbi:MAG TPA: amidohydrolase family protein [Caulobacteraceae bacterium]|nr:amidohydrolase family protein [Caulobacteraceae bacterium]
MSPSLDLASIVSPLPDRHDRLRIDAAFLYTADPARPVITDGALLVEGSTIVAVGSRAEVDAFEARRPPATGRSRHVDAANKMLLPGLVNNHWHESGAMTALGAATQDPDDSDTTSGGLAGGADIFGGAAHFQALFDLANSLPSELGLLFALRSYATQLRSGTTCVADFGSANRPDELARAVLATGIRGVVTLFALDGAARADGAGFVRTQDTERMLADTEAMLSRYGRHDSGRLRAMPSALWPITASDELLTGMAGLADRFDTPWGTHLAGFGNESEASLRCFGVRAIERLHRLGVLSDRLISVHTAYADADEFDWLRQAGAHLSYSPQKYGASGEAPIVSTGLILKFLKAGAPVTFSSDGDVKPMGHMPEAMRMGWLQCNELGGDRSILTPMKTLAMATRLPAQSLGWSSEIGMLAPGMKADFFTVPIDDWRYDAMRRPLDTFLIMGGSSDVDMVAVDGRILVENRALTFIDEAALSRAFIDAVRGLAAQYAA